MAVKKRPEFAEDFVKWFSELSAEDFSVAGKKGALLAELYNNKFPVPPGFIITTKAFDYFLKQNSLKDRINNIILGTETENTDSIEKSSREIKKLIEAHELPEELCSEITEAYDILSSEKINASLGVSQNALNILKNSHEQIFVAVRSSPAEYLKSEETTETFLNVKGNRRLLETIKKCFSSYFSPEIIKQRKDNLDTEELMAVIIEKMVDSQKSGVVFSKDPAGLSDDITIEAVFGLSRKIKEKIDPDIYTVSADIKIKDTKIGSKKIAAIRRGSGENEIVRLNSEKANSQVLERSEMIKVAQYAKKAEEHFNSPEELEFAIEESVFIIGIKPIEQVKTSEESFYTTEAGTPEDLPELPKIEEIELTESSRSEDIEKKIQEITRESENSDWDFKNIDNSCPKEKKPEEKIIEPIDDLENIEEESEKIHEEIKEENQEEIREEENEEEKIEVETENVDVESSSDETEENTEDIEDNTQNINDSSDTENLSDDTKDSKTASELLEEDTPDQEDTEDKFEDKSEDNKEKPEKTPAYFEDYSDVWES